MAALNIPESWQHVVGTVARLLMVWDEPTAFYIESVLRAGGHVSEIVSIYAWLLSKPQL